MKAFARARNRQAHPVADPTSVWGIISRVGRYLFGSKAWAGVPFGYVFWDNLRKGSDAYLSNMEQEASEESGTVYSPVGRLKRADQPE